MQIKRTIFLLFMILAFMDRGSAQDVIYSQFYANPLYLNPALAGSKLCHRITLNYRNQWPGINKGYVSYSATWDQQYNKLSGALGLMVNSDVAGGGIYNRFSESGIYSYRLQLSRNIVLNTAFQAGFIQYKLDWSKLVFREQIDISTGDLDPGILANTNLQPKQSIWNVDFSGGLLAGYKESLYLGVAINHLNRPDISLYDADTNRLQMRLTVHSGMLIDFSEGMDGTDFRNFSIAPNVVYVQQGKFHQLNAGMYVNMYPLVAGFWLRQNFNNPDGVIVLLGFQQVNYKIGYSFDYTISRLSRQTGGAHEISIAWMFNAPANGSRYLKMKNLNF